MSLPRSVLSGLLALGTAATGVLGITASTVVTASPAAASTRPAVGSLVFGGDVSWPNCPKGMGIPERRTLGLPMPPENSKWVIVGLTNGPAYTANPCLKSQVDWVKARHMWLGAYAVTTYPRPAEVATYGGTGSTVQKLFRAGAAQANQNIAAKNRAGLTAPMVWVDVEPSAGRPWSSSVQANQAVVDGAITAYRNAGLTVGLYSYAYGWKQIMGSKTYPAVPTWVPSGKDTQASALAKCSVPSFSGGPVWFGQWTADSRDYGISCPGVTGVAGGPSPLTPYMDTAIAKGYRGPAAVALQRRLGIEADGIFGSATRASVIRFQQARRLAPNGVVTPGVWRALGAGTTAKARAASFHTAFAST